MNTKDNPTKTIKVRSKFERVILQRLVNLGKAFQYEPFRITFVRPPSYYTPDVVLPNGKVIEIKGFFDEEDRAKHLLIKKQYPELNIHFVFQNAKTRLSRKSKQTYAGWCNKHGFVYAEGDIPSSWFF